MNRNKLVIFFLVFLLQISCNRNTSIKEASQKLCDCFQNYKEDDPQTMLNSIAILDSINEQLAIGSMSKKKLFNQLSKDCPSVNEIIKKLDDENHD